MRYWIFIISIIFLDQWTKKKAYMFLKEFGSPYKYSGRLQLRVAFNYGAFYGILKNKKGIIIFINLIALLGCILLLILGFYNRDLSSYALGLSFIIGGGIGNLIDRIKNGYVIDFLYLSRGPIFNIADIFVFIGGLILIFTELF